MSLVLKLTKGDRYIDLTSGRYSVPESFIPPTSSISTLIASSTSANRYNSGEKISERLSPHGFGLPLQLIGNSGADISDAARILANFLSQAGDPVEPVYLEHRSEAALDAEPLWGQLGANMRYEIIGANVPVPAPIYSEGDMRTKHVPVTVTLTLKPTGLGKKQRLASATGGVFEDTIGSPDGHSTGLRIPPATTNLFTNPVFGHSTFDNGWTASGALVATAVSDSLFGISSARLINNAVAVSTFTQAIDVGDTLTYTVSCYAKMIDGATVDTLLISVVYATAKITMATAVGSGWYLLSATVTGIASSQIVGVSIVKNTGVIVDGFQIEQKTERTPLTYGDMLGCAWAGTAHDSATTRTAARVRIASADSIDSTSGTIRIIWKADVDSASLSSNPIIAETSSSSIVVYYDQSANGWSVFFFGTVPRGITVPATFSAGDIIDLMVTFGNGEFSLYVDGVLGGTSALYVYSDPGDYLYIGTDNAGASHANGRFLDFSTYDVAMTAVQVAEDYAIANGIIQSGYRAGSIPWMWTERGDDVVDNCDDSTRTNYLTCGGVAGNVESETVIRFSPSDTESVYYIGSDTSLYNEFIHPSESQLLIDYGGVVDAAYCGGEYELFIPLAGGWQRGIDINLPRLLSGNTHVFFRFAMDSGTLSSVAKPFYRFGSIGSREVFGSEKSFEATTTADILYTGKVFVGFNKNLRDDELSLHVGIEMASAGSYRIDYIMLVNGRVLKINMRTGLPTITSVLLSGHFAQGYSSSSLHTVLSTAGDDINIIPHMLNSIWFITASDNVITTTYTIDRFEVIPRFTTL